MATRVGVRSFMGVSEIAGAGEVCLGECGCALRLVGSVESESETNPPQPPPTGRGLLQNAYQLVGLSVRATAGGEKQTTAPERAVAVES